jgi:hypothetical protein
MAWIEHHVLIAVRRHTGICLNSPLVAYPQTGARILSARQRVEHEDFALLAQFDRSEIVALCEDVVCMLTEI